MCSNWKQKLLDHLVRLLAKMALKRRRCIFRRATKYCCAFQRNSERKREVNNSNFICHPTCLVLIVPRQWNFVLSSRKVGQACLVIVANLNEWISRQIDLNEFRISDDSNFDSFDRTNYRIIYLHSTRNTKKFHCKSSILQGSRARSNCQPTSKARLRAPWSTDTVHLPVYFNYLNP